MHKIIWATASFAILVSPAAFAQEKAKDAERKADSVIEYQDGDDLFVRSDKEIVASGGSSSIFKDDSANEPSGEDLFDPWPSKVIEDDERAPENQSDKTSEGIVDVGGGSGI